MNVVVSFFSILLVASQVSSWTPDDEIIDDVRSSKISKRKAIRNEYYRWTNGVIPYEFDSGFKSSEISFVKETLKQWMDVTCVVFREKQPGDENYIHVESNMGGCSSFVGMIHGKQGLSLGYNCVYESPILHEFGHAIGLNHEHQHPGRDNGITIKIENVYGLSERWFGLQTQSYVNTYNVPYDIDSVMHYNSKAYSLNRARTMVAKNRLEQGRLDNYWRTLSFSDAKVVNLMYKCSSKCGDVKCPSEGFVDKNCRCVTPRSFFDEHCEDKLSEDECLEFAFTDQCDRNYRDVMEGCRRTCDRCPMFLLPKKKEGDKTCFNVYFDDDKCDEWAQRGFCTESDSKKFMEKKCRLACNVCEDYPNKRGIRSSGDDVRTLGDTASACDDLEDTCYLLNKNGQCSDNAIVRTHCPKTCGLCG